MTKLEAEIRKHKDLYYAGTPEITDPEFDALVEELRAENPTSSILYEVGAVMGIESGKKGTHKVMLGSLDKILVADSKAWFDAGYTVLIQDKMDGATVELIYEQGVFKQAITRGNGVTGEDITGNARRMQGVVSKLSKKIDCSVIGEIVMTKTDADNLGLSNPRNGAVGIAKRSDGTNSDKLHVVAFSFRNGVDLDENDKLTLLNTFGFEVVRHKTVKNQKDLANTFAEWEEKRAELNFEVDGVVVKINDAKTQAKLGDKGHNPVWAKCIKYTAQVAETTLLDVSWQVGKAGRLSPVAIMESVKIGGVNVSRASLCNWPMIEEMGLTLGARVIVSRRNDVIPKVERSIKKGNKPILKPTVCPACGGDIKESGKYLICVEGCNNLTSGIKTWIKILAESDKIGFGKKLIDQLIDTGKVKTVLDLYKLTESDIANLDGRGERTGVKMIEWLKSNRKLEPDRFLAGLGMEGVSEHTPKLLIEKFGTVEKVLDVTEQELVGTFGLGEAKIKQILDGMKEKKGLALELLKIIEINKKGPVAMNSTKLAGNSFCFTGAIQKCDDKGERYTRSMMEGLVMENGGRIDKVNKNLTYLVTADPNSGSSKMVKASSLGVKIISEDDFFEMI